MKILHILSIFFILLSQATSGEDRLQRVQYNNPGLVVDLGVGLSPWPVPLDADGDGDYDLIVSIGGRALGGTYVFDNITGNTAQNKFPVFKDGRRISRGYYNITPSYVDGRVIVAVRNLEFPDYATTGLETPAASGKFLANVHPRRLRINQWRYVDYDGDGDLDLTIGIEDWGDYGWDNQGPFQLGFNDQGEWVNGSILGQIYILINKGTTEKPDYGPATKLTAAGKIINGFGLPSQNFNDFDGDGDLDLMTGEFLDGFTYYQNIGTRSEPDYAAGQRLPFVIDLQGLVVVALDWDSDGDVDMVVGQEDGRIALIEHSGKVDKETGLPQFIPPRFFRQQAGAVMFGSLVTPVGVDWDGDGDDDIIAGNTAGNIGFIENLAGQGRTPVFAAKQYLEADGEVIRIQAGYNGSVQGPTEAKWGYTTLSVADWDGDGLLDLIVNSIWGKVIWYRNVGTRTVPKLAAARAVEVEAGGITKPEWNWWNPVGKELVTQWRTTPVAFDWNRDGLTDLVMLDQEGYLALFRRIKEEGKLKLLPAERIFVNEKGEPLKLSRGDNGASGRRKLHLVDWDGDGHIDLLADDLKTNVRFFRNISQSDKLVVFEDMGPMDTRILARHTTSPTTVDWDGDGIPELLVGAEDGRLYHMENPDRVSPGRKYKGAGHAK